MFLITFLFLNDYLKSQQKFNGYIWHLSPFLLSQSRLYFNLFQMNDFN